MKRILPGAAVLGMAAALAAAAPAQAAKTLVYCSEGNPETFNPQLTTSGTAMDAALPVYETLVAFEPGGVKLVPGLAEKWTVSADGLVYTFTLRKGVKFHADSTFTPTRDLTAADVVFSIERQWKKDHPFHKVSGGGYDYFNDLGLGDLLASVEKVDDLTVRITLTRPQAPFLAKLAMPFASVLSAEYAEAMLKARTPEKLDRRPVGTGPFRFVDYRKNATVQYAAFDGYWNGRASLDELVFAITPDPAQRYAKLKTGGCQVMAFPNPADLPAMRKDGDVTVMEQEGLNVGYLAFNTARKPFDDARVRRALNHAVNKKALVDAVFQGTGTPARNPLPATLWGYNKDIQDYPHDPAKAKKLLADAGLANGFETELWVMSAQRPYAANPKLMAEMIQADLAVVGVKAKIVTIDWADYSKRIQTGDVATALYGWTADTADPDNFLRPLLGCTDGKPAAGNVARWCNKEYDTLVTQAERLGDVDARIKLYDQAQVIFKEEAPWIPIVHAVNVVGLGKKVVNYRMDPFGRHRFNGVEVKP